MRSMLLCVVMLVGCDSGAPSCKDAVGKAMAKSSMKDMLVTACETDGWSGEVRKCMMTAATDDAAIVCVAKLDSMATTALRAQREAEVAAAHAEAMAQQAVQDAKDARDKLDTVAKELDALDTKVDAAVVAVASAQSDAERSAARAKLDQLRAEKAEIEQRIAAAKAAADRAERAKGVHISKECLDNPLAKGCN